MSRRSSSGASKPLSSKAAALLADLKSHGSSAQHGESKYVGGLVEAAEKRKLASEVAYEKKLLAEAQDSEGAPTKSFVTKAYEEKLDSIGKEAVALLRGAEKIEAAQLSSNKRPRREEEHARAGGVDARELERRREARRMARTAPTSRLSKEVVSNATDRALKRLGLL
jgi:hypothetical protein